MITILTPKEVDSISGGNEECLKKEDVKSIYDEYFNPTDSNPNRMVDVNGYSLIWKGIEAVIVSSFVLGSIYKALRFKKPTKVKAD